MGEFYLIRYCWLNYYINFMIYTVNGKIIINLFLNYTPCMYFDYRYKEEVI